MEDKPQCAFVLRRGDRCSRNAMRKGDRCHYHKNSEPFPVLETCEYVAKNGTQCSRKKMSAASFCLRHLPATEGELDRCGYITLRGTPCRVPTNTHKHCPNHRDKEPYKSCPFCGGAYRNKHGACRRCPEGSKQIRKAEGKEYYSKLTPEQKLARLAKERERLHNVRAG